MLDWTEVEYNETDVHCEVLNSLTEEEFEEYLKMLHEKR